MIKRAHATKVKCFMCGERPARRLRATCHDGGFYINGIKEKVFCSVRCAANYALLHCPQQNLDAHWCRTTNKWQHCPEGQCSDCNEET